MRKGATLAGTNPLVVLVGPTAVGKSQIGVRLAKALGTELLTADSRQVYRGMNVGTEKPDLAERQGVTHRLIDLVDPDQPFNVGTYRRLALREIDRLYQRGLTPLVVGGTGLYVRALLRGLWEGPSADWSFRTRLEAQARSSGTASLHRQLVRVDPDLASRLHPNDETKIIRGLEVYHLLGRPLSEIQRRHGFREKTFSPLLIGLMRERQALHQRIDERVDLELSKGLLEETQKLLERGYDRHLSSMKGLGYRQMAGYLAGEYDYDEAVCRLKRDTRHFAKRQMTWFRKEPSLTWVNISEGETSDHVARKVLEHIEIYLGSFTKTAGSTMQPCRGSRPQPAAG